MRKGQKREVRYRNTSQLDYSGENWIVTRDKIKLFGAASYDLCWVWILHNQSQSVAWAMTYEGYDIAREVINE